jgi:hypothetical protein
MFQQFEGLVVDEGITLADLKGTLEAMVQALFGSAARVRLRPSFFPYTEPSAEGGHQLPGMRGSGCAICKHTGWLEILGSGMVHPAVLEAVGYDSERYTGFALRHRHRSASPCSSTRGRHPAVLRERSALPRAVSRHEGSPLLAPRVRDVRENADEDRPRDVASRLLR